MVTVLVHKYSIILSRRDLVTSFESLETVAMQGYFFFQMFADFSDCYQFKVKGQCVSKGAWVPGV